VSSPSGSTGPSRNRPQLVSVDVVVPLKCRCGTRIESGGTAFSVTGLPVSLEDLFREVIFCSPKCARTFCLESLEMLDALDTSDARSMVSDLHDLAMEVATTLVSILGDWTNDGPTGNLHAGGNRL
jgi:hypothetical protein